MDVTQNSAETPGTSTSEAEVPPPEPESVAVDLTSICRICYATNQRLISMFRQDARNNHLVDKINTYLPIMVTPRDGRPMGVCRQCYNTILNWHEVVQQCLETEKKLAKWLNAPPKIRLEANYFLPENAMDVRVVRTPEVIREEVPTDIPPNNRWSPHDTLEPLLEQNTLKTDIGEIKIETANTIEYNDSESLVSDDDDNEPLASVAMKKPLNLYNNFVAALKKFRDHYMKEIEDGERSSNSDTSVSDEEKSEQENSYNFDDLTQSNMRQNRMDEQVRIELNHAQTKINGKVYFTCPECGKNLSAPHSYIFHKRIHTGERPCVCHVCGKQFRTPNGLQRHVTETHEKQRRYICVICSKSFANSQNLKQHMRIHTGERPYICSQCGKRFTQSASLRAHLKTHSEQYPHQCEECGAKFRLRSGLTRHKLKHTGERPHICVHCGKGFRQRHDLNSHILTHTDAKPHACHVCGTTFRQRRALKHHCKRMHEIEPRDNAQSVYNQVGHYE